MLLYGDIIVLVAHSLNIIVRKVILKKQNIRKKHTTWSGLGCICIISKSIDIGWKKIIWPCVCVTGNFRSWNPCPLPQQKTRLIVNDINVCLKLVQEMNTYFFDFSYDRTTDRLLWWIRYTSWLHVRMIDTDNDAYWDMNVEWMTKLKVSDIKCRRPPIQTDVKSCLINRFTFVTKTLVKPGDIVRYMTIHTPPTSHDVTVTSLI